MDFYTVFTYYMFVFGGFLFINLFIAGYIGRNMNIMDVVYSLLWPLSLTVLLGGLLRLAVQTIRNYHK